MSQSEDASRPARRRRRAIALLALAVSTTLAAMLCAGAAAAAARADEAPPERAPLPPLPTSPPAPPPIPAPVTPTERGGPSSSELPTGAADSAPKFSAPTGFQFGIVTGYAVAVGNVDSTTEQAKTFGDQVPLRFEAGGKVSPRIFIGGYASWAFNVGNARLNPICGTSGLKCNADTRRFGVEVQYHILPAHNVNPWLGYGIGIETSALTLEGPGGKAVATAFGLEFAHLIAGMDVRVIKNVSVGPVLDLSVAQYLSSDVTVNGVTTSGGPIPDKALHHWLTVGVRFVVWPWFSGK